MCGILAALGLTGDAEKNRRRVLRASRLLRHRGPDSSGVYEDPQGGRAFISFERLNIVDPTDGGRCVRARASGVIPGSARMLASSLQHHVAWAPCMPELALPLRGLSTHVFTSLPAGSRFRSSAPRGTWHGRCTLCSGRGVDD